MDNFMDKLAKRFNAGELIQANGEAEARENQRLREKMDEYDKVMQEVRRLNLKTIEVSEQVSQMAACSIEQIESYQAPVSADDFAEDYTEDFANIREELGHIRENLLALEKSFSDTEETINQLGATVSRVELGNDTSQRSVEAAIRNLELTFAEKMQEPQESEDETLAAINAALEAQSGQQQESAKQIKEMIVNVRLYMDEVQKHIEDYVHKEDVKVYRNVQAVVNEQLSLKTRDLNDHMDQIQKDVQKNKGTKSLVLIAVLLSGASVVLQVLQMLGIL